MTVWCRVAKATLLRSSRPPTELADGFGPEVALRALRPRTHARFTPGDRWVPGPRGHQAARFGGVHPKPSGSRAGARPDRDRSYVADGRLSRRGNESHVRSQRPVGAGFPAPGPRPVTPLRDGFPVWQAVD